VLKRPTDEK